MKKTRAFRRFQRERVINRKSRILRKIGGEENLLAWSRGNTGRFSKNKIHCSCWMCRTKSSDMLSHADTIKSISAGQQLREVY